MYEARDNQIFITQPGLDKEELFLTVHETDTGGTMTVAEQAKKIAEILNDL